MPKRKTAAKPAPRKPASRKSAPTRTSGSWQFPARKPGEVRYWLLKQEPTDFSFDDLWKAPGRTTSWDGVRNFTARNFLRDDIQPGDLGFFYHSNAKPSAIVGIVEVVRGGYPDATAFDKKDSHFDPDSDPQAPRWFQVDVQAAEKFDVPLGLDEIKKIEALAGMVLLRISQLSVQPVTPAEWAAVLSAVK